MASDTEKPSSQAENEVLQLVAELDKGRILPIAERIEKRGVRQFLRKTQSGVQYRQLQPEKFKTWLESCPFIASTTRIQDWTCATTVKLIHWASEARWQYAEQLRTLLKLDESQGQAWLDNLHKVARYHSAIKSMVKFAVKEPGIFVNIGIRPINAPNPRRFKLPNDEAPLLAIVGRLLGKDANSTMEKLEKHLGTQHVETRLRRACPPNLTLHAEMQMVVFYEGNPGNSAQRPYMNLSRDIENLTRQDLKVALTAPTRPPNYDSTAGPSLTLTATVPTGPRSLQNTQARSTVQDESSSEGSD
ncbi:hypothetical protein J7337_006445 [Fusarium musae]|uniref:Uncharacterized protein n=1 Tax=Fusarium musae TaxID=1042133 RepID=A0A9P8IPD9_9HYPO|nr:hypothetical protein J7337_006445 [Fusarium musae]KAG9500765.1 hypothetical protein J7337_006445 [Fusarium musae]